MTAWNTPRTWTNTTLSASDLNTDVRDNELNIDERLTLHGITSPSALNKFKQAKVGVRLAGSGTQSISNTTDTTLTWDAEGYDTDAFHSTVSVTNRITIPSGFGGTYLVDVGIRFAADATGDRRLWVEGSGGALLVGLSIRAPAVEVAHLNISKVIDIDAGDWISARVYQSSGGALNVDKSISASFFQAVRLFAA